MKQIRKGILLARHDHMVSRFRGRHENVPENLLADWVEVYTSARCILVGENPLSHLTIKSYFRTLDRIIGGRTPVL